MIAYDYISFIVDPVLRHTRRLSPLSTFERPKALYGAIAEFITTTEYGWLAVRSVGASDVVDHQHDAEAGVDTVESETMRDRTEQAATGDDGSLQLPMRVASDVANFGTGVSAGSENGSGQQPGQRVVEGAPPPGPLTRTTTGNLASSVPLAVSSYVDGVRSTAATYGFSGPSTPDTQAASTYSTGSALPEDDGQGMLRRRIVAIQGQDISLIEKAQLIHAIMNDRNCRAPSSQRRPSMPTSTSPLVADRLPGSPSLPSDYLTNAPTASGSSSSADGLRDDDPYGLTVEDLTPTFTATPSNVARQGPNPASQADGENGESQGEDSFVFGCRHYQRKVKLQCSTCHRWYTCRFCHDEREDHFLIRKETEHMLCMLCRCSQPAADECVRCGERMAWYYCDICKLWDDDTEKSIYHCHECGICRVGRGLGKDYFHCKVRRLQSDDLPVINPGHVQLILANVRPKTCGVCMSISIADSHKCIERSTDCDCPICGEYMFTSPETVVFMPCGHSIHHKCYHEHMKSSYRCPICSRSIVNMEAQFRNLDRAIDSQPMPANFRDTKAVVCCNDCCAKSSVPYHWLGLKCAL